MGYALNCFKCNALIETSAEDLPVESVLFRGEANPYSEVFDPEDGTFLEIVICDNCLKTFAPQNNIHCARDRKAIRLDIDGAPQVGWLNSPGLYSPVYWHENLAPYDTHSDFWIENVGQLDHLPHGTSLWYTIEVIVDMLNGNSN